MAAGRTLHVRCASWEQVTVFTTRKLRKGKLLSMKVPFAAKTGMPVTLGLELPNQLVIEIAGVILRASQVEGESAGKTWIEVELIGFTEEVHARIRAMATAKPAGPAAQPVSAPASVPVAPQRTSASVTDQDLPADERELFLHLSAELRRLRQAAVHDVLGVDRDATPDAIRAGWKDLVRRHHPDLVARRNAPAISHLAEELTILSNRAYDRLRSALVAEGRALSSGPRLSVPPGWLVGFEDLQSTGSVPAPSPAVVRAPSTAPSNVQGGEAFEQRARAMLAEGDAGAAREVLAAALVVYPRSKALRSLYYVATALVALSEGELQLATAQLETALAHHEQCAEASLVLDHVKKHGRGDADRIKRLFQ